jgi:transposase
MVRTMTCSQGVSPAAVQRIWGMDDLQPYGVERFKFSTDPDFVDKVWEIVGLYLNPPDKALVLSVDEKSQIKALDRTQPILHLRPSLPERQTHDYERHGITPLFSALNALDTKVIIQFQPRHRHQKFLRFLNRLENSSDPSPAVHVIMDNYGTHKHPEVKKWFAAQPRYHVHFTTTGSSWLNQIEHWVAEITSERIGRGTFRNVPGLVEAIESYICDNNDKSKLFAWTATASRLFESQKIIKTF